MEEEEKEEGENDERKNMLYVQCRVLYTLFGWALLRPVSINYGINDGDWDVMPCK